MAEHWEDFERFYCKQRGWVLSELAKKTLNILGGTYRGLHHIPDSALTHPRTDWSNEHNIEIVLFGELATTDDHQLCLLVFLALEEGVRVSVEGASRNYLRLYFSSRVKTDDDNIPRHVRQYSPEKSMREILMAWRGNTP